MEATYGVVWLNEGVVASNDVDVIVLDAMSRVSFRRARLKTGETHALRKTMRPMRPKPLIPTWRVLSVLLSYRSVHTWNLPYLDDHCCCVIELFGKAAGPL